MRRVLIAANDWKILSSARCRLEGDGYQVFVARSSRETLKPMRDGRPNVLEGIKNGSVAGRQLIGRSSSSRMRPWLHQAPA